MTHDERTLPRFAFARVEIGEPVPGIVLVPDRLAIGRAIEDLVLVTEALDPEEMARRVVVRLPL